MTRPGLEDQIDMFGRMTIALEEMEACRELAVLIPEVRTNMVFAPPLVETPDEVLAIDGRITIINGMPKAAGRIRFGASGHMARFIIGLMKTDPSIRAAIDFANPPVFTEWLSGYCRKNGWTLSTINRQNEPQELAAKEGSSMSWKAKESVRVAGGSVPKIICDTGGMGKEPVCVIVGNEPIEVARDLCRIARAYAQRGK
jgi:hydroxymethylpyrimidine/phosphomethylpyrimidine kinase